MVQDIEHFGAKLEFEPFANRKVPMHREIPLRRSKAPQNVTPEISLADRKSTCWIDRRSSEFLNNKIQLHW